MEISIVWNVCRICLQEGTSAISGGDGGESMKNIFSDETLANQIFDCSGIMMEPNDSLPQKICRKCLVALKKAIDFRTTCRNSDLYLQTVIQQTKTATSLFKPKDKTDTYEDDEIFQDAECERVSEEMISSVNVRRKISTQNNSQHTEEEKSLSRKEKLNEPKMNAEIITTVTMEKLTAKSNEKSIKLKKLVLTNNNTNEQEFVFEEDDEQEFNEHDMEEIDEHDTSRKVLLSKGTSECSIGDEGNDYTYTDLEQSVNLDSADRDRNYKKKDGKEHRKVETIVEADICDVPEKKSKRNATNKAHAIAGTSNIAQDANDLYYILSASDIKQEFINDESNIDEESTAIELIQVDDDANEEGEEEYNASEHGMTNLDNVEYLFDEVPDENETHSDQNTNDGDINEDTKELISNAKRIISRSRWKSGCSIFVCSVCGNNFTSRSLMNCHMRVHRNEKNYECELCYKRFNAACNLTAHMRIHTGEKRYECQYCKRRFTDRSTHIKHERIHTNEKPFVCNFCGKSFSLSTTLKAHERIHTGEKPYKCEPCSKSFKLAHQLKAHLNTHLHKIISDEDRGMLETTEYA